jgi:hypothetical protein
MTATGLTVVLPFTSLGLLLAIRTRWRDRETTALGLTALLVRVPAPSTTGLVGPG